MAIKRRNVIVAGIGVAAAGVATGTATGVIRPQAALDLITSKEIFQRFRGPKVTRRDYDRVSPASAGEAVEIYRFDREVPPTPQDEILRYLEGLRLPGGLRLPIAPTELRSEHYTKVIAAFEPDKNYGKRIVDISRTAADNALAYWNSPQLQKPRYRFDVPAGKDDISSKNPYAGQVVIYLVYSIASGNYSNLIVRYGGNTTNFETPEGQQPAEIIGRKFTVTPSARGVDVVTEYKPVLIALNADPIYLVEAPPLELLRNQLSGYTTSHLSADIAKLQKPNGSLDKTDITKEVDRWNRREEIAARRIVKEWLGHYGPQLGFTRDEIEGKNYGPLDTFVRRLQGDTKTDVRPVIEMYVKKPDILFTGYGI